MSRFPSPIHLRATARPPALDGLLDYAQFAQLKKEGELELRPFVASTGQVELAMPALVETACTA